MAEKKFSDTYLFEAAEAGEEDAQYALGDLYEAQKDYENAMKYFKMAAEKDHLSARFRLADLYEHQGEPEKAQTIYQKLMDEGYNLETLSKSFFLDPLEEEDEDKYLF